MLLIILEFFIWYNIDKNELKLLKTTKKRSFTDTNISKCNQLLEETNVDQIMELNCPNEAFDKCMILYMCDIWCIYMGFAPLW